MKNQFRAFSEHFNFAQNFLDKHKILDFSKPNLVLERTDDFELRQKILSIPYHKAKEHGLSKGTLWYMKQNAKKDKRFKIYKKVKERL